MRSIRSLAALVTLLCSFSLCQDRCLPAVHAESHTSDTYVLVLHEQATSRGPDSSQKVIAVDYGKHKSLRDFIWFRTEDGCFAVTDSESIKSVQEFVKAQDDVEKRREYDEADPLLTYKVRDQQEQRETQRDEFIWKTFDWLKATPRFSEAKVSCPRP